MSSLWENKKDFKMRNFNHLLIYYKNVVEVIYIFNNVRYCTHLQANIRRRCHVGTFNSQKKKKKKNPI